MVKRIDKDFLYDLYITQNLARKEVAEICGVTEASIKSRLKTYKIVKTPEQILESNRNYYKKNSGRTMGLKWYNNGEIQTLAKECPDGFIEGRLENTKNNQSKSLIGHIVSKETKNKISNANKGKKHTEEAKRKISKYMQNNHPLKGTHRTQGIKNTLVKSNLKMEAYKKDQYFDKHFWIDNFVVEGVFDRRKAKEYFNTEYYLLKKQEERIGFDYPDMVYSDNISIMEEEIRKFVQSLGFNGSRGKVFIGDGEVEKQDNKKWYEIDIYVPELNVGIEFNGIYFHSYPRQSTTYHYNKSKVCKEHGIRLIHVWEDQWLDERLNPIIKEIIKSALKVKEKNKPIYARKCEIRELDPKTYKDYCDKNHTQLSRWAQVRLGLFYNNELVQLASFSPYKGRNGKKSKKAEEEYDWEWVRGCEAFNHSRVIGGVSKLFKYFIRKYNPQSVLCYSDFNFFYGNGYINCGFVFDGYTGPEKFYIDRKTKKRINRSAKKYKEYMKKVKNGDWYVCYGAGSMRFVWKKLNLKK